MDNRIIVDYLDRLNKRMITLNEIMGDIRDILSMYMTTNDHLSPEDSLRSLSDQLFGGGFPGKIDSMQRSQDEGEHYARQPMPGGCWALYHIDDQGNIISMSIERQDGSRVNIIV